MSHTGWRVRFPFASATRRPLSPTTVPTARARPAADLPGRTTALPISEVFALPAVLAGGAGVVLGTAALLSTRAAARPDLPAARWYRQLPPTLAGLVDSATTLRLLRTCAVVALVGLVGALVMATAPVDARVVVPAVTSAALVGGTVIIGTDHPATAATAPVPGSAVPGWTAVAWFVALALIALSTSTGPVLAGVLVAHVALLLALARRTPPTPVAHHGPLAALMAIVGHLAPLGRDQQGRPAWRNPVVNAAHAALPHPALWLTAVVAGLALAGHAPTPPGPTLAAATLGAGAVLRVGIFRPYFTGVLAPVAAAYGLIAAGRWLAPVDLLAFVALHAVAIAVLHRQAIARHDPRTARAVQFLPRTAVVISVLTGLWVLAT